MKTIHTEYGFDDIYIVPRNHYSKVQSRKNVDTSISVFSESRQETISFDLPIMLAPMAFFGERAIRIINNRFLGFLPRIKAYKFQNNKLEKDTLKDWSDIDVRIQTAKELFLEQYNFGSAISIKDDISKIHELSEYAFALIVDTANGYSQDLHDFVIKLNNSYTGKKPIIISGNVVSNQGYHSLIESGTQMVRVGIGSGSNCITSDVSSIGRPPLSAILEIYEGMRVYNNGINNIICDGGVKNSHDLSIALLLSEYVMSSGMFKNTELNDHVYCDPVKSNKVTSYGMASEYAKGSNDFVEGKLTVQDLVKFEQVYKQLKEGLQSAMSYLDAHTLQEYKETAFDLVHSHNYD